MDTNNNFEDGYCPRFAEEHGNLFLVLLIYYFVFLKYPTSEADKTISKAKRKQQLTGVKKIHY
jgi:hypothetical protein